MQQQVRSYEVYETAVITTVLLSLLAAADYVRRTWKGYATPMPATWILINVVMGLSFWMYWVSPRKSWTANIGITAGIANAVVILVGVLATNIHHGTLRFRFNKVQKRCLVAGGGVVVFWLLTDRPLLSYVLVQGIALIAYFATARGLWKARGSTEPLSFWSVMLLANLCAIYPAWVKNDPFSWIFLGRAVPSMIVMLYLIIRAKRATSLPTSP